MYTVNSQKMVAGENSFLSVSIFSRFLCMIFIFIFLFDPLVGLPVGAFDILEKCISQQFN